MTNRYPVDTSMSTETLLEKLGKHLIMVTPNTTISEERIKNMIIKHQSGFPSKIRPAIAAAASETSTPRAFLSEVKRAVMLFFYGQPMTPKPSIYVLSQIRQPRNLQFLIDNGIASRRGELITSVEWHGLDRDIDTEEEAELAIRLFPGVLDECMTAPPSLRQELPAPGWEQCICEYVDPLKMLTLQANAISFVPLFVKLRLDLFIGNRYLFFKPFSRHFSRYLFLNTYSEESSAESLSLLARLRETGLVKRQSIDDMYLLWHMLDRLQGLDVSFIAERMRLLIDGRPSVLKYARKFRSGTKISRYDENLLLLYFIEYANPTGIHSNRYRLPDDCHKKLVAIFGLIVEHGMHYFPNELGFVFHKSNNGVFIKECKIKGLAEMVRGTFLKALGEYRHSLSGLVVAVATNREISLDGLYTLVRYDPITALNISSLGSKKPSVLKLRVRGEEHRSEVLDEKQPLL